MATPPSIPILLNSRSHCHPVPDGSLTRAPSRPQRDIGGVAMTRQTHARAGGRVSEAAVRTGGGEPKKKKKKKKKKNPQEENKKKILFFFFFFFFFFFSHN